MSTALFSTSGALFSDCRKYRYCLWRHWDFDGDENCVMFIGKNPSIASEHDNDPTITREINFAQRWGFGGLYKMNLYAFVSTDVRGMVHADDPIGPDNDKLFGYYAPKVGKVVAAWGTIETRYRPRIQWQTRIKHVIAALGVPLWCFGRNDDGSPKHPLFLKGQTELEIYTP